MTKSDKQILEKNGWIVENENIRHENGSFAIGDIIEKIITLYKLEDLLADTVEFQTWDDVLVMSRIEIYQNFGVIVSEKWEGFMKARDYRFFVGEILENESGRLGFNTMLYSKDNPNGFFIELRFIKKLMNRSKRNIDRPIFRVETEF